jgi:hypothetical protein
MAVPLMRAVDTDPRSTVLSGSMDIEERMFQLAIDALAEQERQASETRGRAPTLLAAGAVVASLLAGAIFRGRGPHGTAELISLAFGVLGGIGLLSFSLALLWPKELAFSLNATETYRWLFDIGLTADPGMDLALADSLSDVRDENRTVIDRLTIYLRIAVIGLALEAAGLAAAAAIAS